MKWLAAVFLVSSGVGSLRAQTLLFHSTLDNPTSITSPATGTGINAGFNTSPANDFVTAAGRTGIHIDAAGEHARFRHMDATKTNIDTTKGTIEFWYKPDSPHTDGVQRYFFRVETQWDGTLMQARKDTQNMLWFELIGSGNNYGAVVDPRKYSWSPGQWVRLRFTWDVSTGTALGRGKIFINGQEPEYTHTAWQVYAPAAENSSHNFYVGNNRSGTSANQPNGGNFPAGGVIDDFKIYDIPLPENLFVSPPPVPVTLPQAAHAVGQTAGFYTDPETGNKVYRLTDATLCPNGGSHFYSYYRWFSTQGDVVVGCNNPNKSWLYDKNYKLLGDVQSLAGATYRGMFWSAKRRVLLGSAGKRVMEMDPFNGTTATYADFSVLPPTINGQTWTQVVFLSGINGGNGPNDEIVVSIMDGNFAALGIATYNPLNNQYRMIPNPVGGFLDDAIVTHNSNILLQIGNDMWIMDMDLNLISSATYHAHHGTGFLSNGQGFIPGAGNSPDCPRGPFSHWRPGASLWWEHPIRPMIQQYNCNWPGDTGGDHWAMVDVPNVFLTSTNGTSGALKEDRFYEYGIVKGTVTVNAQGQASIGWRLLARHRSHYPSCGYWYSARVAAESFTGNRAMFDSNMANPAYPGNEKTPGTCGGIDVYVVEDNGNPTPPPPPADIMPPARPKDLKTK